MAQGPSTHAPFCKSSCSHKHHPLLVAILNFKDSDVVDSIKGIDEEMKKLEQMGLPGGGQWMQHLDIPDAVQDFQFSALHWACALGYKEVAQWLISRGIPSRVQHKGSGQTPLHRALICLQKTCGRVASSKMAALLPHIFSGLVVGDSEGNTPLHLACTMLHLEKPCGFFYIDCINNFLSTASQQGEEFLKETVNKQNRDGDTSCHILAMHDRNFSTLRSLVESKADLKLKNNEGLTAFDVSIQLGMMKISCFLRNITGEQHPPPTERNVTSTRQKNTKSSPVIKADGNIKALSQNGNTENVASGVKRPAPVSTPNHITKTPRVSLSQQGSSNKAVGVQEAFTTPPVLGQSDKVEGSTLRPIAPKILLPHGCRAPTSVIPVRGSILSASSSSPQIPSPLVSVSMVRTTPPAPRILSTPVRQSLQQKLASAAAPPPVSVTSSLEQLTSMQQIVVTTASVPLEPRIKVLPSAAPKVKVVLVGMEATREAVEGSSVTAADAAATPPSRGAGEDSPVSTTPQTGTPKEAAAPNSVEAKSDPAKQGPNLSSSNMSSPSPSLVKSEAPSYTSESSPNLALTSYLKACNSDLRKTLMENILKDEATCQEKMSRLQKDLDACRRKQEEVQTRQGEKTAQMQHLLEEVMRIQKEVEGLSAEDERLTAESKLGMAELQKLEEWSHTIHTAVQDLSRIFDS